MKRVATSFSWESCQSRNQICVSCIAGQFFTSEQQGELLCVYMHMYVLMCLCAKSLWSSPSLWGHVDYISPGSSVHGDCPRENNEVDCLALLQRIFLTQGSNLGLLCLLHLQVGFLPVALHSKPICWWKNRYMGYPGGSNGK